MTERGWKRSATLAALLVTSVAASLPAAETPAPAIVRSTAGGTSTTSLVVTTATMASAVQRTTITATSAIRSVVPGAATAVRPPAAPVVLASPGAAIAWEGEMRYRYESRLQLDYRLPGTFGRPATQSLADRGDISYMRTRVSATRRIAPGVRGYLSLQDARTMGAEGSPAGTLVSMNLYNAWLDLDSLAMQPLGLRVGRQVLSYGEGRILDGSDWSNAGRGYDGARLRWSPGHAQVDGFVTWINEGRLTGQDRVLSGVDALWRGRNGFEAELFHFRRSFGDPGWTSELGNKGGIHDATSGLRTRALRGAFELRLEGAMQRGRRAGDPVNAGFSVGRITADLKSAWKTKLFAEHALSSGDTNPTDANFQRFDPVYWGGHGFQGTLDIAGESNMSDWRGGLTAQPVKGWTVQSEFHVLSLARSRDVWVDDSGNTLRRDVTGAAGTAVGHEFDATVRWDTRSRLSVLAGGSRFWRGEFVRKTGGGGDVSWGFVQLNVAI